MKISTLRFVVISLVMLAVASCQNQSPSENNTTETDTMIYNDVHSFSKPVEALITHLHWKAEVNFNEKIINGVATFDLKTATNASTLILDTKDLNIEKVTLDDGQTTTDFELSPYENSEILGRPLQIKITPDTRQVNIHYSTSPKAEALQWLTPQQTAGKEHPFLFTQSQAILARSWIPIQDSPGIRFTYTAEVKVPQGLLALMSAENPTEVNETGIYQFIMDQPIPAYLMALSVGNIVFEEVGARTGVYAEPELIDAAAYEFAEMEDMLVAAEDLYGQYRWEQYDLIVLPPSFPFGGMENPRLTFATPTILAGDRSLTALVAHELAHSWSGNLVTNANWNDFWLNEGFTVYFERRIMETLYGKDYVEMLSALGKQDLQQSIAELKSEGKADFTHLKLDLIGKNPDDGLTDVPYEKGFLFLKWLENQAGRSHFDAFLKKYFNENAFQSMTTEAFLAYLKQNLIDKHQLDITDEQINSWVFSPGLPATTPSFDSDRFAAVDSTLQQWQAGTPAGQLTTSKWSTHEWLHFIRNLPKDLSQSQMQELDQAFGFTSTGNSEMLVTWLIHTVRQNYEEASERLEQFLITTGRRKFLVPLYKELSKTEVGMKKAMLIYQKARENYHHVSTATIDEMLGWKVG